MNGGKLYCEIAKKAACTLGARGKIDCCAEDWDDYHSQLTYCGYVAEQKARLAQKSKQDTKLYVAKSIWNAKTNIIRHRSSTKSNVHYAGVDVDYIPIEVNPDSRIDASKVIASLQMYLSPKDWQLIDSLVDAEGGVARAYRLSGCGKSLQSFVRSVLSLRGRVRAIISRVASA